MDKNSAQPEFDRLRCFATLLKAIEAPDKDKLELMGHTSTEMLRHYQHTSYNDLRKITDLL